MTKSTPFALLVAGLCALSAAAEDPVAIAERSMQMMGADRFAEARVLDFTWAVERGGEQVAAFEHTWDRWSGDYRVSGTDRESGEPWIAIFNTHTRDGRAWLGGEELDGEALAASLERAYGRYINDTYWLLMPWKWLDDGVELAWVGSDELHGRRHDVVELTFTDGTGLTSGDRYWAYVEPESGLMTRWEYVLQQEDGSPGEGEPSAWDWEEWREVEPGVWFSMSKSRFADPNEVRIYFPSVSLVSEPSERQLESWFGAP